MRDICSGLWRTKVLLFIGLVSLGTIASGDGAYCAYFMVYMLWIVPSMDGTNLYAKRRFRLPAIDAGLYVVRFVIVCALFIRWKSL